MSFLLNFLEDQRLMLDPLLRYWLNASYATLDYNVPFVWKAGAMALGLTAALTAGGILLANTLRKK